MIRIGRQLANPTFRTLQASPLGGLRVGPRACHPPAGLRIRNVVRGSSGCRPAAGLLPRRTVLLLKAHAMKTP
jgi:hypothetical protein